MGPVDFTPNAKHFPAIKTPMLPANHFKGKVAYVTGGGTGLGKDMATTLSSLGAKVFKHFKIFLLSDQIFMNIISLSKHQIVIQSLLCQSL